MRPCGFKKQIVDDRIGKSGFWGDADAVHIIRLSVCGGNFVCNCPEMSVQPHSSAEVVKHTVNPGSRQKFLSEIIFPSRFFFSIEIKYEGVLFVLSDSVKQLFRRIFSPGLNDPDSLGIGFKNGSHDLSSYIFNFHSSAFAAFMERIGCVKMRHVAENISLAPIKQTGKLTVCFTVGFQHIRSVKRIPFSLRNHRCIGKMLFDINRNHSRIALQYGLHSHFAHEKMILSCKFGMLFKKAVRKKTTYPINIRHIEPRIISGTGNKGFNLIHVVTELK